MTQDRCLCFPLHVRSDMVAMKVPPGSLTGWRIKIFFNNVGRILLFAVLHRYLTVKSEQGQYWRNEPRNLAGSWRCGFLLTVCEIFGLTSWVFSGLVMDAAAGRLLWDILFGWSLSIHVHSCTISLVYNIICWIFLVGSIAKMEISFRNNSTLRFLFTSYVLLLLSYSIILTFEGTLACSDIFCTYIYLFILPMELQLRYSCVNCFIREFCDSSVCFFSLWITWGYWSVHFQIYLSVWRGVHSCDCAASPRTDIEQWCHHLTWKFDRRIMVSHIFPFLFSLPLVVRNTL